MASMDLDLYIFYQLNNKFRNQPVLIDRLIIATLHHHHPQDFFPVEDPYANSVKECYVLTPTHLEYGLFTRPDRRARNGYWRPLGDGKKFCMNGFVGFKETLCFYEGELGHGRKTSWKMIEYKMRRHECTTECTHRRGRLEDWVLCRVFEELTPETLSAQMESMSI